MIFWSVTGRVNSECDLIAIFVDNILIRELNVFLYFDAVGCDKNFELFFGDAGGHIVISCVDEQYISKQVGIRKGCIKENLTIDMRCIQLSRLMLRYHAAQ